MRNSPETRASLILRLRDRDDLQAWQEFSEIYQPLVFRLAVAKGFQHSDALDLAQEVLVRVAGAVDRWDPAAEKGSFRGWLYRIARNLMIDFLNRDRRQPSAIGSGGPLSQDFLNLAPARETAESRAFDLEFRRQVFNWAADRIQSSFTDTTWTAFWRTAVENQPAVAVAAKLNLSVGAVYVARSRVMQRFRQEVRRVIREELHEEVTT